MESRDIVAFCGTSLVGVGPLTVVLTAVSALSSSQKGSVVFFDLADGKQTDFDLSGSLDDVLTRVQGSPRTGPGRPKLGVVSIEVTLLPRHWAWLNAQPGRASGTLRRLVEEAMASEKTNPNKRLEALGTILWAIAGDQPDFEEASRALYAGDRSRLNSLADRWSGDLPAFVKNWI